MFLPGPQLARDPSSCLEPSNAGRIEGTCKFRPLLSSHGVLRLQGGLSTQPTKHIHWSLLSCRIFQIMGGHTGAQAIVGMTPAALGGGNVCSLFHQCYFYSSLWTPWSLSLVKCFSLSEITTVTFIIIYYSSLLNNDTRLMPPTPTMLK